MHAFCLHFVMQIIYLLIHVVKLCRSSLEFRLGKFGSISNTLHNIYLLLNETTMFYLNYELELNGTQTQFLLFIFLKYNPSTGKSLYKLLSLSNICPKKERPKSPNLTM